MIITTIDLQKSARAIFIAVERPVAQDISDKLNWAAGEIERLRAELSVAERGLEMALRGWDDS